MKERDGQVEQLQEQVAEASRCKENSFLDLLCSFEKPETIRMDVILRELETSAKIIEELKGGGRKVRKESDERKTQ